MGFDVNTYNNNLSNVILLESRIKKLDGVNSVELKDVCEAVRDKMRASYEEANIKNIVEYIEQMEE